MDRTIIRKSAVALLGLIIHVMGSPSTYAGPLQQAEVNKIVNDVRVVEPQKSKARPAKVRDVIKDDLAVKTGVQSRAELLFQDQTLTRLGSDTLFSFKTGTRNMMLDRGTMLLQVPKGLGGARIQTAAVTAAITGTTIMMENIPGKHVKVVVLEGSLRLSVNGRVGEAVVLNAGKMIIIGAKDKRMPKPVTVDLRKLVKTAALVDPDKFRGTAKIKVAPLPSIGLIEKEIALQDADKAKGQLAETNLLIQGDGTQVVIASQETMSALDGATKGTSSPAVLVSLDDRSKPSTILTAAQINPILPTKDSGSDRPSLINPLPIVDLINDVGSDIDGAIGGSPGSGSSGGGTSGGGGGTTPPAPLPPIITPVVETVDAVVDTVTGTFTPPTITPSVNIATDVVAADVTLTGIVDDLTVSGAVTTNNLTFDAGASVSFDEAIQVDVLVGAGSTISLAEPVGGSILSLDSPIVTASSLNATASIQITGVLQPVISTDLLVRAPAISVLGGIDATGRGSSALPLVGTAAGAGGVVILEGDALQIDATPTGINGIKADGGDAALLSLGTGGSGGAVYLGTETRPITGDVTIAKDISATTGANATILQKGGQGGTVSVVAGGAINVQSNIRVSDKAAGRASASGGRIRLDSRKTTGTAISISNSSQLLSLLDNAAPGPGGRIEFVSAGGDILIDGSTAQADKGTVEIRNTGAGNIVLNNATLRGDVVKANVLGANGQLLIGGGSIDANSAIKLYASGANGSVVVTDNVTLNGNSVKTIAGNTVTINNGKIVTVNGLRTANVFTNNPNYTGSGGNGSTTGKFGGRGATTKPFNQRPAY
jgi:hypothetical protein